MFMSCVCVFYLIVFYYIPRRKSGILRIQYGHAATAAATTAEQIFPFGRDNLKNILVRPFKFGMLICMGNATNAIVL